MDILRLRTMARKSTFHFGALKDVSVQQALNLGRKWKLVAIYYYMGNISYQDDILEELGITGDLVIDKPGLNRDMMEKWKEKVNTEDTRTDLERLKAASHAKKKNKAKRRGFDMSQHMNKKTIANKHRRKST